MTNDEYMGRIYDLLKSADMTRWEIAKAMRLPHARVLQFITAMTFSYPDIYEYQEIRKNKKTSVYSLLERAK